MRFVFTPWYFVMVALVVGIVACLFFFFKMDKQDKVIINKFLNEAQPQEEEAVVSQEKSPEETVRE